jgi:hypothetical protein
LLGALALVSVAGCQAAAPLAPSPAQTPSVQNIRGTVRETQPFPHIRVAGATVSCGSAATSTDEYGFFSLTPPEPCQTISAVAPGYERAEVQLPERRREDELVDLELMPLPGEAEEHRFGTSGALLDVGCQHGGPATITLEWSSRDTDFDVILWRGSRRVAYSTRVEGTREELTTQLEGGVLYELVVFRYSGPDAPWSLTIHRPR